MTWPTFLGGGGRWIRQLAAGVRRKLFVSPLLFLQLEQVWVREMDCPFLCSFLPTPILSGEYQSDVVVVQCSHEKKDTHTTHIQTAQHGL